MKKKQKKQTLDKKTKTICPDSLEEGGGLDKSL